MPNPADSAQVSESLMNNLEAVGFSDRAYLLGFSPKRVYVDSQLKGVSLKILRDNGTSPAAEKLVAWLKSAFDSLHKKYVSHCGFCTLK
jgi:hypothetical protein